MILFFQLPLPLKKATFTFTIESSCSNYGDYKRKGLQLQPFFKNNDDEPYFREGVTSMEMGGNVGTSCYLLSCFALKSKPIGLLAISGSTIVFLDCLLSSGITLYSLF